MTSKAINRSACQERGNWETYDGAYVDIPPGGERMTSPLLMNTYMKEILNQFGLADASLGLW